MARKHSEKVTSEPVPTLAGEEDCRQREQLVRGPEASVCLVCSVNTKKAAWLDKVSEGNSERR